MSAVYCLCVSYAGFALITYGYISVLTYWDEYYSPPRMELIVCAVLWPLYWGAALGYWLYDTHREWKARGARKHERKREPVRAGRRAQARNAQQDPGDTCPHCGMPVHVVHSHRGWRIQICGHCGPLMPKTVHQDPRKSNAGLLCVVTAIAVLCVITCMVCTAISCWTLNEIRSSALTREARTE